MGFLTDIGAPQDLIDSFSSSGYGFTILIIFGMVLVAIIVGYFTFRHYWKKYKTAAFKNQVPIFLETNGKLQRDRIDWAKEIFIPDTNISLFFLKNHKLYIARPTRSMGKNEFWYKILDNGEWVNFNISSKPKDNSLAIANYDHRDTRYAYTNLSEIIKKNYKDKSTQWWKEYSGVITIVIVAIMFIGAMWFFFWRTGRMIDHITPIIDNLKIAAERIADAVQNSQNINSGVITTK